MSVNSPPGGAVLALAMIGLAWSWAPLSAQENAPSPQPALDTLRAQWRDAREQRRHFENDPTRESLAAELAQLRRRRDDAAHESAAQPRERELVEDLLRRDREAQKLADRERRAARRYRNALHQRLDDPAVQDDADARDAVLRFLDEIAEQEPPLSPEEIPEDLTASIAAIEYDNVILAEGLRLLMAQYQIPLLEQARRNWEVERRRRQRRLSEDIGNSERAALQDDLDTAKATLPRIDERLARAHAALDRAERTLRGDDAPANAGSPASGSG